MTEPGLEGLESVTLVVTASCNLSCRYCYQNAKSSRRMSWKTLSAGMDLVLGSRARTARVAFVGGEPLLEAALLRRAVDHAVRAAPPGKRVSFSVITNGTLVDESTRAFLVEHDVELRLSMDGGPAAQDLRGAGTFAVLDRLLADLARGHPDYFRRRLSVGITLVPETVGRLAESVRAFLGRGVPSLGISPVATHEPGWAPERIGELDEQFAAVYEACLDHRRRTGTTPLGVFRRGRRENRRGGNAVSPCGVGEGRSIVVDVDGSAMGCTLFTGLSQRPLPGWVRRRLDALDLGRVDEPGFAGRLEGFRRRVREADLFADRRTKYSAYGRCRECRHLQDCTLCPMSSGHIPGNEDPDRVSDFACAYHRTALKWRDRFPPLPNLEEILAGGSAGPHTICERAAARPKRRASSSTATG